MDCMLMIDPDIQRAATLPSRFYSDRQIFDAVGEKVFARSWQFLAHRHTVRTPGSILPVTLLEGLLDEPLVVTRDAEDRLHCLSNVCTHRGNLLCDQANRLPGKAARLRCRYHGRLFSLDGRFQSMPEFEAAQDFPTAADDLPRLPLTAWGPLLLTSLDPAFPVEELLAPLDERVGFLALDQLRFDPSRSRDYLVQANWALYCDNYLEGFHIPFVHSGLAETLDYGNYRTELFAYSNLQVGVAQGGEDCFDLPPDHPDAGQRIAAYYFWLFPNLMLNFYPWGLSLNVVRPLTPERTKVSFLTYVLDPSRLDSGAGAGLDRVEREDEEIVEAVQRGVASRLYDRGRYSPTREQGVHHFHRLLCAALS